MSYGHKLVSAVQDRELKTPEDWSVMVGTLDQFAFAVRKAARLGDLRFAQSGNYAVNVYRPHDKYILGTLSVRHDAVPEDYGRMEYSIYSRTIENKRYGEYNAGRNTRSSTKMQKAVKLAVANLRPYKPVELAHRHGSELWSFVEKQPNELRIKQGNLVYETLGLNINRLGSNDFEAELRHLVRSGHSFMNPELGNKMAAYFQTKDLRERAENMKHDMVYLRVYVHNDQQLADIATIPHDLAKALQYRYSAQHYMDKSEQMEAVPVEQLGVSLVGRVSVLSMLQVEQGEPGIGYKASDDEFFVYPEPEVADA
jgi:hypothetical protein